jgi:hypothetical protein
MAELSHSGGCRQIKVALAGVPDRATKLDLKKNRSISVTVLPVK